MTQAPSLDQLAKDYEEDLRYLIYQVTSKDFESLINSFYILTDLFCLIKKLERLENNNVDVLPPTSISDPAVLEQLNIELAERRKVRDFLQYVETKKGMNFEQLINTRMRDYDCNSETIYPKIRAAGA
jgi:hypothetical protein